MGISVYRRKAFVEMAVAPVEGLLIGCGSRPPRHIAIFEIVSDLGRQDFITIYQGRSWENAQKFGEFLVRHIVPTPR